MRIEAETAGGAVDGRHRRWPLSKFVIGLLLVCALAIAGSTVLGLVNFTDVGYPDSAILLRIGDAIHSGLLYPDPNRPPYLVTVYGPLTYILLGLPYRLAEAAGIDPQTPVRLGVAGALSFCVWLIFLIARRVYGGGWMAWVCALFAVSSLPLAYWSTQIRGDFLGLGFSLAGVYLILSANGRRQAAAAAAIFAGMAPLTKQTFVTAPVAVAVWLICRRRYKHAALWSAGVGLTVAGGYAMAWWREPLMLQHFAALRQPIVEYPLALRISLHALAQPVAILGVIGSCLIRWKDSPDRLLLFIYGAGAWLVALLTIPQVGGNINYFWEPLMVSALFAGPGLRELQRRADRTPAVALVLVLLLASPLRDIVNVWGQAYREATGYQVRKAKWESFLAVISGRRLLSTFPAVTIHSSIPEIPDPYLNSTLELGGRWSSKPVADEMDAGVYDLVVIAKGQADYPGGHRGLQLWSNAMWAALKRQYALTCAADDMEVWLPRGRSTGILPQLTAVGCQAPARNSGSGSGAPGVAQ